MEALAVILVARFAHAAAGMALLGAPLFLLYALPRGGAAQRGARAPAAARAVDRIVRAALPVAVLSALAWTAAALVTVTGEAASLAEADTLAAFLLHTGFGRAMLARLAVLAAAGVAAALPEGRRRAAAVAAAGALLLAGEGLLGHAGAAGGARGALLVAAQGLHGLGAGVWFGGLLPLIALLDGWARAAPQGAQGQAGAVLWRFSRVGIAAVLLVGAGGCASAVAHLDAAALPATPYGRLVAAKAAIYLALVVIAARNRHLAAGLHRAPDRSARLARIAANSRAEVALAALALALAAALGMIDPAG